MNCRHSQLGTEFLGKVLPKLAHELGVAIGDNDLRQTMQSKDLGEEQLCDIWCSRISSCGEEVSTLAQSVDYHEDGIIARLGGGELDNKVHRDLLPVAIG